MRFGSLTATVLAAVFAVSSCNSTPPPTAPSVSQPSVATATATAAPAATGFASAALEPLLEQIALQPDDVDAVATGFQEFDVGATANADRLPPPQSAIDRFGRIAGWKARFRQPPDVTAGVITIDSRVDLFGAEAGAAQDLAAYTDRYKALAQADGGSASAVKVGDQA